MGPCNENFGEMTHRYWGGGIPSVMNVSVTLACTPASISPVRWQPRSRTPARTRAVRDGQAWHGQPTLQSLAASCPKMPCKRACAAFEKTGNSGIDAFNPMCFGMPRSHATCLLDRCQQGLHVADELGQFRARQVDHLEVDIECAVKNPNDQIAATPGAEKNPAAMIAAQHRLLAQDLVCVVIRLKPFSCQRTPRYREYALHGRVGAQAA